jgi:hypothetical protein
LSERSADSPKIDVINENTGVKQENPPFSPSTTSDFSNNRHGQQKDKLSS